MKTNSYLLLLLLYFVTTSVSAIPEPEEGWNRYLEDKERAVPYCIYRNNYAFQDIKTLGKDVSQPDDGLEESEYISRLFHYKYERYNQTVWPNYIYNYVHLTLPTESAADQEATKTKTYSLEDVTSKEKFLKEFKYKDSAIEIIGYFLLENLLTPIIALTIDGIKTARDVKGSFIYTIDLETLIKETAGELLYSEYYEIPPSQDKAFFTRNLFYVNNDTRKAYLLYQQTCRAVVTYQDFTLRPSPPSNVTVNGMYNYNRIIEGE